MDVKNIKLKIIAAGEKAVKNLIKVAEEDIIKGDDEDLSADKLKNAAATKKLAIFDAFDILDRINEEKNLLDGGDREEHKPEGSKSFAERRASKKRS